MRIASALLALWLAAAATAGEVSFVQKPAAMKDGDRTKITFAVSAPVDVAVSIEDSAGRIVRHLAAGALGPDAPDPLKAGSLAQSLGWDGKDDDGKPVAGPCTVRVAMGLGVKVAGEYGGGKQPVDGLAWDGRQIDGIRAIAASPDGTAYVLGGWWHPHLDRTSHIIAVDAGGNYLREVYPPSAALIPDRTPGMPTLKLADDRIVPQVQTWWDLFLPEMTEPKAAVAGNRAMVVTPDRHLLVSQIGAGYVKERLALLKIGCDGSIPSDAFRLRLPPGAATSGFGMALSPDAGHLYVSGTRRAGGSKGEQDYLHVVHRLALDGTNDYQVFFGEESQPGSDDRHLDRPAGVAVDARGNVYVADYRNNRVVVVKSGGSRLRSFAVKDPLAVQVDSRTGTIYVLTAEWKIEKWYHEYAVNRKVLKLSPEGRELASADLSATGSVDAGAGKLAMRFAGFALDTSGPQPVVLVGMCTRPDGCNGYPFGYSYGILRLADTGDGLGGPQAWDWSGAVHAARRKTWPAQRPLQYPLQRDGYRYGFRMRSSGDPSVIWMLRYTADGKEAPFPVAGEDKWVPLLGRRSSRYWFRALVNYQGDILAQYYNYPARGDQGPKLKPTACIDLVGTDGTVKQREFVFGLREGNYGPKVDRRGCVYVADLLLPPGRAAPREIERAMAAAGRRILSTASQAHPYGNSYGSILKLSPRGGGMIWGEAPEVPKAEGDLVRHPAAVWEPVHKAHAACENVEWMFVGGSPLPSTHGECICSGINFDLDDYDRLYVPDAYRMCVHVLDSAGNYLLRIGRYGNQDDARTGKGVVALARPRAVEWKDHHLIVTDPQNGRATVLDLTCQAQASIALP